MVITLFSASSGLATAAATSSATCSRDTWHRAGNNPVSFPRKPRNKLSGLGPVKG